MSGTSAISTTSRRELSSIFFFLQGIRRRKLTPFWQKHYFFSFLVGLRTYQHPSTSLCKTENMQPPNFFYLICTYDSQQTIHNCPHSGSSHCSTIPSVVRDQSTVLAEQDGQGILSSNKWVFKFSVIGPITFYPKSLKFAITWNCLLIFLVARTAWSV